MIFIDINKKNINLLEEFLSNAGDSLKSFRYFEKRDSDVLKNHLCTYILMKDKKPIGYGHLDRDEENNKVWLGICVSEKHINERFGYKMMEKLTTNQKDEIYLTVDKNNKGAIKLFEKFKFKIERDYSDKIFIMKRDDSNL